MTSYLDTSVLVAALCNEEATGAVQAWLAKASTPLLISGWTITEFSSAMAPKLRAGHIGVQDRAASLSLFNTLIAQSLTILPVTGADFRTAATVTGQHQTGLRAGDALHLAVAFSHGATLHTLDHRLANAGPLLGVTTHLLPL